MLAHSQMVYVADLPLEIQRGFRIKMLTILLLQLCLTNTLSLALRLTNSHGDPETGAGQTWLSVLFPAKSVQCIILGASCLFVLPLITYVRDRHPWNLIVTVLWTIVWSIFLAAAQLPGSLVLSNTLFVVFGTTTLGVACLLVFSTMFTTTDIESGEKRLWSFRSAGLISGIIMIGGAFAFYSQTTQFYTPGGVAHFIMAVVFATCIFFWVVWDSTKLCERMQPDDYMKGVVYFYTDFLMVCCCCLFAGCVGSAAA